MFRKKTYQLENGKSVTEPRRYTLLILVLIIIAMYVSADVTGFKLSVLMTRGKEFFTILQQMLQPNFGYLKNVWKPLLETIQMSLLGSLMGASLSLPFAFLAADNMIGSKVITSIFKFIFSIIRTIPTLVSALVMTYIFGIGSLSGLVAIFLFSFSYVGKLTYESIENTDMGAFEALTSIGCTKIMAFRYGIMPQILPIFISTSLYNFEGNVRYAAILGYVGAGGIGLIINEQIGWRAYNNVGTILLLLFLTVFIIERTSAYLRSKVK